jgi:hydrophobic/amphiphilic exporter-1 (mainly G- bacteria), HAE1 family
MSFTDTVIHRPTTILIIFTILCGVALLVYPSLSVELFPEMELPMAVVYTTYQGASPETVEETLTKNIEAAVSSVRGISSVTSRSSEGYSMVMIEFDYGTDLTEASNSIKDNLDMYERFFPEGSSSPTLFKLNTNMMPVMNIAVLGEQAQSANELKAIAEDSVQPVLDRVSGVSTTSVSGGQETYVQIAVSQNRLEAYGVTLTQIVRSLAPQNYQIGSGTIENGDTSYLVRTNEEFSSIDDIRQTLIASVPVFDAAGKVRSTTVITLEDLAEVSYAFKAADSNVFINGEPGVYVSVSKESDSNSVEVAERVKETLISLNAAMPESVSLYVISDTTTTIESTMDTVYESLGLGIILAMAILFFFLRSVKSTVIIGLSIPISMLITILFMFFFGYSLNLMTLTGLILGLGMIVDCSVVVLENIFRYRERGAKLKTAALLGTKEMIVSITASTLTTICVFVPIVLFQDRLGMLGQMVTPMAATIIISLLSSLLVSVTLVPVLASSYMKIYTRKQKPISLRPLRAIDDLMERSFQSLDRGYKKILTVCIDNRWLTAILAILILVISLQAFGAMDVTLYPPMAEDSVSIDVELPQGTVLETTEALLKDLETNVKQLVTGYEDIIVTAGGGGFFGNGSPNAGTLQIILSDDDQADDMFTIKNKLRLFFDAYPSAVFSFGSTGMGLGNANPMDLIITSDDLDMAADTAQAILALIKENLPGITEPKSSYQDGLPQIQIEIDRERAYAFGLTMQTIASEISYSVNGVTASQFKADGDDTDIIVLLQQEDRDSELDLEKIFVKTSTGQNVSVANLASITRSTGPVTIIREDERRAIHVTGGFADGYAASAAQTDIEALIAENLMIPESVQITYGGDFSDMNEQFDQVIMIFILAVILVFGVMASLFESLKNPFIILLSMPFMIIGIVGLYLITGETFSMLSAIGVVVLAGIVVNNGIVLIEQINLLRRRGQDVRTACIEAGGSRLKPILMTSLTTILGMIPMAFLGGSGAEQVQPIGQTIVGGMALSTLMTIFVTPTLYSIFNTDRKKKDIESIASYQKTAQEKI